MRLAAQKARRVLRACRATLLWYEFASSVDRQKLLLARDCVPTSRKVDTPLNRFPLRFVDSQAVLTESAKREKRYVEISPHRRVKLAQLVIPLDHPTRRA